MKPAGFEASQGIITTAYLKDATDPQWATWPDMVAWNAFMDKYQPQGDKSSSYHVYAYAVSSTLIEVLKRCGNDLTRANIMSQAANLNDLEVPLLLPNIKVNTSPTNFYPIQSVRLQRFRGDMWEYSLMAWLAFTPTNTEGDGPVRDAPDAPDAPVAPRPGRVQTGE